MSNYIPNPKAECLSPTPCPDPCATQAYILKRQTQPLVCDPINSITTLVSLLAYWKMEEDNITRQDSHTGNYDLTKTGTIPSSSSGKILNAAVFDHSAGNTLTSADAVFGLTGAYSMALWMYFTDVSAPNADHQFIIGKYNPVSINGYKLILEGGQLKYRHSAGGVTNQVISSAGIITGQWYFIVCGSDGTDQFIQVNNTARETSPTLTPNISTTDFSISADLGEGQISGRIDEVGVWLDRVLTVADVNYLYNGGSGRTYPFD